MQAVADMRDGRRDFSIPGLLRAAVPFIVPLILASIVFVILFALGLLLLIIPGLLVLTWFCLFTPVIVVERRGVFDAFGRSQDLVKGNAWRVFGVLIVTVVIVFVVGTVLQRIFLGIDDGFAGAFLGNAISNLITAPVFAIVVSTLYFMLRDLREGPSSYPAQPPAA